MTQQRHHKLRWFRKVPQDSREVRIGSKTLEDLRVSEERFKQFFETWPEYCYMISPSGNILDVNTTACKALGYSKEELVGRHVSAIYAPESLSKMSDLFERWKWSGVLKDEELVVVTKQGQKRTVLLSARSVKDAKGNLLHSTSVQVDITDLKRAVEVRRESEERFRLVANAAPVMIWMSGTDKLCTYFNQPWLDFTGRSVQCELGNGWTEGVHPEDSKTCLETYTKAFDQREKFSIEYRLRRHDGEYRWILDTGVPRFMEDGSFAGYIGSCIDVSEQRLAEQALSAVSRKLIDAQEQERARIARELHDDICQRLGLLALELDQLQHGPADWPSEVRNRMGELWKQTSEIATDLQSLSHELHSARLELMGVAGAMRVFCKELGQEQKVEIDFQTHELPSSLPPDISLCLFRVLQEALHNSVKHSGVRAFEVRLWGTLSEIHLTVRDSGVGFDAAAARVGHGLGLISMEERLRLLSGTISIESQPNRGTAVHACVPFSKIARATA